MTGHRIAAPARANGARRRPSYAHVAAALALFFALSSGALAAKHFLITSTKQIKPNALSAIRGGRGAGGTVGTPGLAGPKGPTGEPGLQGPVSPVPTVLAPEQTETGVWGGGYEINEGRVHYRITASFPIPLSAPMPEGSVGYVPRGSPGTDACPGRGQAAPGVLCLYEASSENLVPPTAADVFDPEDFEGPPEATGRSGFAIELSARAEDPSAVRGSFAVTAGRPGIGRDHGDAQPGTGA